ncbi:MAG: M20/M25/M40 family metallo-hydrolase [Bdellovibrionota bacterium]
MSKKLFSVLSLMILTGCLYDFAGQESQEINYQITSQATVETAIQNISQAHMNEIIIKLSSFPTRSSYTQSGLDAFTWIENHWREITNNRADVDISLFDHQNHIQSSIILTITGSDPNLKNEIIVLGAHGDSINANSNDIHAIAPGADDNAAGVAVLSEILRRLVETDYKPQRTLQFIIYAAEEPQDRASCELTRWYRQNNQNVMGVINFDGTNYKVGEYDIVLIDDYTNKEQNTFIGSLIDTYVKVKWAWQTCGYQCSDHASWSIEGYRASFPFESLLAIENPNIHTANDTFDKSGNNSEHASLFVKLGLAYLIELDK